MAASVDGMSSLVTSTDRMSLSAAMRTLNNVSVRSSCAWCISGRCSTGLSKSRSVSNLRKASVSIAGLVSLFPSSEISRRSAHSRKSARNSRIWLFSALRRLSLGILTSDGSVVSLLSSRTNSRTRGPNAKASSGTDASCAPLRSSVRTDPNRSLSSTHNIWHPSPSTSVCTAPRSSLASAARADAGTSAPLALTPLTSTLTGLGLASSTTSRARTGGAEGGAALDAELPPCDDGGSFGGFGTASASSSSTDPPPRRNDVKPPAPKTSLRRLPLLVRWCEPRLAPADDPLGELPAPFTPAPAPRSSTSRRSATTCPLWLNGSARYFSSMRSSTTEVSSVASQSTDRVPSRRMGASGSSGLLA